MTPLDDPWPLATWPDVPTRVLAARHDRMFPLDFQRRIERELHDFRQNAFLESGSDDAGGTFHYVGIRDLSFVADKEAAAGFLIGGDRHDGAPC